MITYEFPLNERIRTLLRLEDLFDKALHFTHASDARDHHMALVTLFEMVEIAGRADLKFDLMQELERQRQALSSLRNNPEIAEDALARTLAEIAQAAAQMIAMQGKVGQHLRDNEWLMSIKHRTGIPGGACEFDLPSYHYWLNRDSALRRNDIDGWLAPLLPVRSAITIILRLLRSSGHATPQVAALGVYQLMMTGRVAQLIRLRVRRSDPFVPEIGANKYALNIRFLAPDTEMRPKQAEADIPFDLTFCNL